MRSPQSSTHNAAGPLACDCPNADHPGVIYRTHLL